MGVPTNPAVFAASRVTRNLISHAAYSPTTSVRRATTVDVTAHVRFSGMVGVTFSACRSDAVASVVFRLRTSLEYCASPGTAITPAACALSPMFEVMAPRPLADEYAAEL